MKKKNKKGFTLLEVILVLAILGIIIPLSFSFFTFGTRVFKKGGDQSNIQHNIRMASRYITEEIRTAKDIELLEEKPSSFENFNYIYVEGSKIIHRKTDGSSIEILKSEGLEPVQLSLEPYNDSKTVSFIIRKDINNSDFQVKSKVSPLNLTDPDKIQSEGVAGETLTAIKYSDPIIDPAAIVRLDALLLDLYKLNQYLDLQGDTLVLDVPTKKPNRINLPTRGEMGSTITWSTSSNYIDTNLSSLGTVYRKLWSESDEELILKATIEKDHDDNKKEKEKEFKIKIRKLEELNFIDESLTLTVNPNTDFSHQILGIGGNPGYIFSSDELPAGTNLDPDGTFSGEIESSVESLRFPVRLIDSHTDTDGSLSPNEITKEFLLKINTN